MTIPHRGTTTESTYFVTANVLQRKSLFQVEKIARLFIEILLNYRTQKKYLLHEFVVMPDHFHLIITPTGITLERAMQFVKGGFSFQLNKSLKIKREVWQTSFVDRRVRDSLEYERFKDYIWQNPVKSFLVAFRLRRLRGSSLKSCSITEHRKSICYMAGAESAVRVCGRRLALFLAHGQVQVVVFLVLVLPGFHLLRGLGHLAGAARSRVGED